MAARHDRLASRTPSREQASARHDALSLFRIYGQDELGADGYPVAWHRPGWEPVPSPPIKDLVRAQANHRCERCHHPYRNGEHGNGEWSLCDDECIHDDTATMVVLNEGWLDFGLGPEPPHWPMGRYAQWRILTVHHLNGVKADCRWWNLASLCQRDHLSIQGKVCMERAFILEHSAWFKPHAAGFYAWKYEQRDITREEALARMDELLAYERLA